MNALVRAALPLLIAPLLAFAVGCSSPPSSETNDAQSATAQAARAALAPLLGAPSLNLSREEAVTRLRAIAQKIDDRDFNSMIDWFAIPKGFDSSALVHQLELLASKREISKAGVELIAKRGAWGPAQELLGAERAARLCGKFGADATRCLAIRAGTAEAVFCPLDGRYRLVRLNNIGKLTD